MSEEKQYVAVRIPKLHDDLINKYIEVHEEEMRFLGYMHALYELLRF